MTSVFRVSNLMPAKCPLKKFRKEIEICAYLTVLTDYSRSKFLLRLPKNSINY